MKEVAYVAAGGAIGAALRHLINVALAGRSAIGFPWQTVTVNVAGAFLIGVLIALPWAGMEPGAAWRLFLVTGILGGFTTFSALSYESLELITGGHATAGLANMFGSGVAGLVAAWAGVTVGKMI
ncbi:MAG: CrcB family protein [Coriobacteriia bacterium]|nr:CrcB family protein [Coriobacteriia bacterium]